jgi:alkanesulfonate monooxygenase SsuD/methylene tetrahydromethanopterin reductase-like flavin-dependent oxidoreductase (luciferase family)
MAARIGLALPSRSNLSLTALTSAAKQAEQVGVDWISINEAGNDPLTASGHILSQTSRVTVATGVVNMHLRHPLAVGAAASQLCDVFGDRFVLGVGTGHADLVERGLGLPMDRPLARIAEYVRVVRSVTSGRSEDFAGRYYRMDKVPVLVPAASASPRINVAVLRETSARRLAPLADGIVFNLTPLEHTAKIIGAAREAVEESGRDPDSLTAIAFVHAAFGPNGDRARYRDVAARLIAGMTQYSFYSDMYASCGFEVEARAMAQAMAAGNPDTAASLVTDALLESLFALDDLGDAVERYRQIGVDVPILYPHPVDTDWQTGLSLAAEALGPLAGAS